MFRSYLKIAWRNLARNKGYSLINIGGLAIGLAVAMLNGLWIWDELSFNQCHENYDRIAQVVESGEDDGEKYASTTMTYPLGTELITNYHEPFEHVVRASWISEYILSTREKKISGQGIFMDDKAPEMLTLKMIRGGRSGLQHPGSVMISASIASALFGSSDPLNKNISLNNKFEVKVSGVYEDLPMTSSFYGVRFFGSWKLFLAQNKWIEERALSDWRNHFIKIYTVLQPGVHYEAASAQIEKAIINNIAHLKEESSRKPKVSLMPMSRWHLFPLKRRGNGPDPEPMKMVYLVGTIGVFVLMLACINFMNLSTARSEKRAKEVGIRKTIGSVRWQLIHQFLGESLVVSMVAFVMALIVAYISLPWFNSLSGKAMSIPWNAYPFWLIIGIFICFTGIVAGSYPAIFLSAFQPIKVLKGTFRAGRFASLPRKILVVVQFSVSVVLIISTIVVYQQIQFAQNRPVGYTREGLIMVEKKTDDFSGKYDVLRNALKAAGVVDEISESMGKVTEVVSGNNGFSWPGKDPTLDQSFASLAVTHEHGKTVGWTFVKGRDFSSAIASDSNGLVINESAAKIMGLEDPVGQPVTWSWWENNRVMHYKILGVIRDVVMDSPYEPVEPTLFFIKGFNGDPSWINIRISSGISAAEALPKIEAVFNKIIPAVPFEYKFADEEYTLKFAAEQRIGELSYVFASLAVLISCLGLFGLSSFVAEQRTKEIGIRKVLGASILNVWRMLSADFVMLVLIATFIAMPIAYYFLQEWLMKYQYRIEISAWVFAGTAVMALVITLLTVSFQALKAGTANPVKSLRSE
jgi:putative ABC transport system permease protein